MSASTALTIVGVTIALGIVSAILLIRSIRRRSYTHWPRPVRWLYFALVGVLVVLGAAVLVNDYVLTWGWPAALWFLAAPALYGLSRVWPTAFPAPPPPGPTPP